MVSNSYTEISEFCWMCE